MKKILTSITIIGLLGFLLAPVSSVLSQDLQQLLGSNINTSQQFFSQGHPQTGGFAGGEGLVRMFESASYPTKCPSYQGWYGPFGHIGYPCHSCHDYVPNCKSDKCKK